MFRKFLSVFTHVGFYFIYSFLKYHSLQASNIEFGMNWSGVIFGAKLWLRDPETMKYLENFEM